MINKKLGSTKLINIFKEKSKFHHIGLSVKSIKSMHPNSKTIIDPLQKVRIAFINLNGVRLELLEPLNKSSPIYNNLKNNNKLCHICFEVDNINKAIKNALKKGFYIVQKPVSAIAFNNRKVSFIFHRDYHLVELILR